MGCVKKYFVGSFSVLKPCCKGIICAKACSEHIDPTVYGESRLIFYVHLGKKFLHRVCRMCGSLHLADVSLVPIHGKQLIDVKDVFISCSDFNERIFDHIECSADSIIGMRRSVPVGAV